MTTKEKDAIREMMQTEGWRILVSSFRDREKVLMEDLIHSKPEDVVRNQIQIRAIREVMQRTRMLLEGGPNEEQG